MRNRWFVLIAVFAAIVLTAGAVGAVNQYRSRPLDMQNFGIISPRSTDHALAVMGGWGPSDSMHLDARGGIVATLSVTVSGGPVDFSMFLENVDHGWATRMMHPSLATFDPGTGTASSSFTFVAAVSPGSYTVNLKWGSPTGVEVTLVNASLVVQYGAE
jgi:hypothetical protein